MMSTQAQMGSEKMVFRKANAHAGRHISVSPSNSTMRHLAYGRIILSGSRPSVSFSTGDRETGLICLSGEASIKAGAHAVRLGQYDAVYIPRDSSLEVSTKTEVDLAEFSADVENSYPFEVVRFAEIAKDPGLKFTAGGPASSRHLHLFLAKNIQAGRLIAGFTYSEHGNWTSWPPHEHAAMLEEMYVYFDMPAPAYGIQLVYNNTEEPELVTVVRDGDVVLMPGGYHPNVSVPGHRICFLWAMAAHVVNLQPGFDQARSGLEPGRKK